MDEQPRFCSECKYAKDYETDKGLVIICTRYRNATNIKADLWHRTSTIYRKFNATACPNFDAKEDR